MTCSIELKISWQQIVAGTFCVAEVVTNLLASHPGSLLLRTAPIAIRERISWTRNFLTTNPEFHGKEAIRITITNTTGHNEVGDLHGLARGEVRGGLARSDLLVQRLADLLGRPVVRAAETETTALGAALLAGLATDVYADIPEALSARRPGTRFDPSIPPGSRREARHTWSKAIERTKTA